MIDFADRKSKVDLMDYQIRMINEYRYVKDKAERLHNLLIKYDAGTLEFGLNCPVGLLRGQETHMNDYLRILEIRAEIEGIGIENL